MSPPWSRQSQSRNEGVRYCKGNQLYGDGIFCANGRFYRFPYPPSELTDYTRISIIILIIASISDWFFLEGFLYFSGGGGERCILLTSRNLYMFTNVAEALSWYFSSRRRIALRWVEQMLCEKTGWSSTQQRTKKRKILTFSFLTITARLFFYFYSHLWSHGLLPLLNKDSFFDLYISFLLHDYYVLHPTPSNSSQFFFAGWLVFFSTLSYNFSHRLCCRRGLIRRRWPLKNRRSRPCPRKFLVLFFCSIHDRFFLSFLQTGTFLVICAPCHFF